jgi:very-short-patch-repair endonuclease
MGLGYAKKLRSNMTDAERRLWYRLRAHRFGGIKFKLRDEGFRVLRFWNNDVLKRTDTVLELVLAALKDDQQNSSSPGALRAPPSPRRGEGKRACG